MRKRLDDLLIDTLLAIFVFPIVLTWWLAGMRKELSGERGADLLLLSYSAGVGILIWCAGHVTSDPRRTRVALWIVVTILVVFVWLPAI